MTAISRRIMLGGFAATAGGVIATTIPLPAPAAVEPVMTPEERLQAAVSAVVDILREMNPDHADAEILRDQGSGHVVVVMKIPPKPVEWSGPGFYKVEGKHRNGKLWGCTLRLDRVEYKTVPGFYYRAETYWKGRLETTIKLKPGQFRIVSRDDEYAALHGA